MALRQKCDQNEAEGKRAMDSRSVLLLDSVEMLLDSFGGSSGAEDFVEVGSDEIVADFGTAFPDDVEEHLAVDAVW